MRSRMYLLAGFATMGCGGGKAVSDDDEVETDGLEVDDETDQTTAGVDACAPAECPTDNPCQRITCCGPSDPNCETIFHDTQVVLVWAQASSGCTTGCHSAANPAAGLALVAESDPWCALVDRPSSGPSPLNLVEPGEPLQSYLWHKLGGTHECPGVGGDGSAMPPPPNQCPLAEWDPVLFDVVTQWICCGAPKSPDDPLGMGCF